MDKRISKGKRTKTFSPETGFDYLTSVMNSIGTAWVFVLLILINSDILGRAVFDAPIRGVPEMVSLSIVACVFLQIAHTLKVGRLTRSEMFLNWLDKTAPKLRCFLEGAYHLVGGILMLIILKASFPFFLKAWKIDEYVGAEGDFMAPVWPVKLIIISGCLVSAVQFFIETWKNWRSMGGTHD